MSNLNAVTKNPFIRALVGALPRRMKRIVFLASLTAIAKQSNVPERALMEKLNEVLRLSTTGDTTLKLPIYISELIWANKQVFRADIDQLTQCTQAPELGHRCAERIAEATPPWLSYAEPAALADDIVALFSRASCLFAPSPAALH